MSRIGKLPVSLPAGVEVVLGEQLLSVRGSGGELRITQSKLCQCV